jgi:hypothetical protein
VANLRDIGLIDEAYDKYGVKVPTYAATPVSGSNLDSPRAQYYLRNEARAGFPATTVTKTNLGTTRMGETLVADPTRVSIDQRSHDLLNIRPEWTRVHEGQHQDMLMSGRKDLLPYSAFVRRPIGVAPLSILDFSDDRFGRSQDDYGLDISLQMAIGDVSKKYHMGKRDTEFLADLKAYEAQLPRGTDISQTPVWQDLVNGMGDDGKTPRAQLALKQWYLYNNMADPQGKIEKLLKLR